MTRKRYIKLLMAAGYSRNEAASLAAIAQSMGVPYAEALSNDNAYQFSKAIKRVTSAIVDEIPSFIEGIVNAAVSLAETITAYLTAAVEAAKAVGAYLDAER